MLFPICLFTVVAIPGILHGQFNGAAVVDALIMKPLIAAITTGQNFSIVRQPTVAVHWTYLHFAHY